MSRPERSARTRLAGLAVVAFLLGLVATPSVQAQPAPGGPTQEDVDRFGGFIVSGRGNGFQLTYDSPGLLPTGSPIFQLSVPEALATLNSGPVGYALASFAYPGPLVADLGAALAASGTETGIPPYPVRAEAFFPSGPTEAGEGDQGTEMTAVTEFGDSRAHTSFSGLQFGPAAFVGSSTATSQSVIEGGNVVSRARSFVSDVVLFGGIMTIESVVTDIVATSNGAESDSAGRTRASGVAVLGMPAVIDDDGIRFSDTPSDDPGDNPVGGPVDDALGGALDPVQGGLEEAVGPLNDLFDQLGIAGDDALQQLFDQAGIRVELLDPIAVSEGGTAERTANGLSVTMDYDGSNTPVLTELLSLVPSESLPAENLGPVPFSPQGLFNLMKETHITGVALAPANVVTAATPAFELDLGEIDIDVPVGSTGAPSAPTGGSVAPGGSDFETATPELPPAADGSDAVPTSSRSGLPFGDAIPALLVLGALLGGPFFAAGSRRLADNTLAGVASHCPDGLDATITEEQRP
jgi:hypothetical protein